MVHPKAPFGVVSMRIDSVGREIGAEEEPVVSVRVRKTLTLAEWGKNAVSELPTRK